MKKVLFFLAIFIFFGNVGLVSAISATEPSAEAALPDSVAHILIEASTGRVLSEANADERLAPASLTKIMLLLLAAEEINAGRLSFDALVTVSSHASKMDGSVIWLEQGESMSVADLVKSVVISSANDAAVALAEHISGSEEEFVKLMNRKAYVLGMSETNFVNAAGYDHPDHYTTAKDAATMSRALMRDENYELFSDYMLTRLCSVRAGTDREAQLLNTNKLITYYNGIEGIKTGTTDNAGHCLAAAATRDDMRLISVVMGCKDEADRVNRTEALLDYGFGNYELYRGFGKDLEPFENLSVAGGVQRELKLAQIRDDSGIVIQKGRAGDIDYRIYLPEKVTAPIARNQPVGTVTATLDGKVVHESYITAEHTVHELTLFRVFAFLIRAFLC